MVVCLVQHCYYSFRIVADRTIGYLVSPPLEDTSLDFQLIPFYFVRDILLYEVGSWYFWHATNTLGGVSIIFRKIKQYAPPYFKTKFNRN